MKTANRDRPKTIVFVPQTRGGGGGEYMQCLALARGAARRWPECRIAFATSHFPERFDTDPFPRHALDLASPGPSMRRMLEATRPDVVVLNNAGKQRELRALRASGSRLVYLASTPRFRARALEWRLLRHLDEVWLKATHDTPQILSRSEQRSWRFAGRPEVRFPDTIFDAPTRADTEAWLRAKDLERDGYVVFAPGAGGWEVAGRPAPDVFLDAAERLAERSALPCVVVRGAWYSGGRAAPDHVRVFDQLPQPHFLGLLEGARLAVTNGGGLLHQALALGQVCVGVPLAPQDQAIRVGAFAARGAVQPSTAEPKEMADHALALLAAPDRRDEIRRSVRALRLRNGTDTCLDGLGVLLERGPRPRPRWRRARTAA